MLKEGELRRRGHCEQIICLHVSQASDPGDILNDALPWALESS